MPTIAAVTIVFNESAKLPRWVEYYSRQLGPQSCYVIDHGSDDGSTDGIVRSQLVRIPRTPYDNQTRIEAISSLSHFLLKYYDYVIYVDCDEILVADPAHFTGLGDFCNKTRPDYLYSIGIDVVQKLDVEPPLRADRRVMEQRAYGHFSSAMCKANLVGRPVRWAPGFHSHQYPPKFGPLFNFHLRYVDLDEGLKRQSITRALAWAKENEGEHHKTPDEEFKRLIQVWSKLQVADDDPFSPEEGLLAGYLYTFRERARKPVGSDYFQVDLSTFGSELIKIPARFRGQF